MDDKELAVLSATILGGLIAGERVSADEKTLKRSIDLAYRLKTLIAERLAADPAHA
jgi:hypothetical protein